MDYLNYRETPVVEINHPDLDRRGVQLLLKREDLNHKTVSGNKWWKLKYNLAEARRQNKRTLLTFGGAYSNHIYATAATAAALGFASIGIIRGEKTLPLNPTLEFATRQNMTLHYLSRDAYRQKSEPAILSALCDQFGDFYLIPEGGTNSFAVQGTAEFGVQLLETRFDYALLAVGTGGTLAGLIRGFQGQRQIIGVPVFKGSGYLVDEIKSLGSELIEMETASFMRCMELIDKSYHVLLCVSDNSSCGNALVGRSEEDTNQFHLSREINLPKLILALS